MWWLFKAARRLKALGILGMNRRNAEMILDHNPRRLFPLVDDKLRVLAAVKGAWGARVTTVFPRQGHYAHDPEILATNPAADLTVERIGDLLAYDFPTLVKKSS